MRILMEAESDGVTTRVEQEFDEDVVEHRMMTGEISARIHAPDLGEVNERLAQALTTAHRP